MGFGGEQVSAYTGGVLNAACFNTSSFRELTERTAAVAKKYGKESERWDNIGRNYSRVLKK